MFFNSLNAKYKVKVTFMPARASPSGFTASYHFSISPTCGFALGENAGTCFHVEYTPQCAGTCFHVEYTPHPALEGLKVTMTRISFSFHFLYYFLLVSESIQNLDFFDVTRQ